MIDMDLEFNVLFTFFLFFNKNMLHMMQGVLKRNINNIITRLSIMIG